jgi:type IV pilus assembly protein PilM
MSNPPDGKFCAGCGRALWEPCLKCGELCAVGEAFCHGCGTNLAAAVQERRAALEALCEQAEQFAAEHRFEEALHTLAPLQQLADARFADCVQRADLLCTTLTRRRSEAASAAAVARQEAEVCLMTRDYEGVVRALEGVPPPLRDERMRTLLADALVRLREMAKLEEEVRTGLASRNAKDACLLLAKAERLLKLKPDNEHYQEWHGQLEALQQESCQQERERVCLAAKQQLAQCAYDEALETLGQLPASSRTPELAKQMDLLSELAWLKWELRNAPVIDATLLAIGERLLKVRPDDREAAQLMATLQVRAKTGSAEPPMAAQHWMWPEDATALGGTVEWVGGFRRLTGGAVESKVFLEHPGCFFVAAGLALQGLGEAQITTNLLPQQRRGLWGKKRPKLSADTAWGLDISSSSIKAIRLRRDKRGGRIVAENCDHIPHKKHLSRPDAELEWHPIIQHSLQKFLERNDVKDASICASFSLPRALGRFFRLPPVGSKRKIAEIIRYETTQQVPFPLEQVAWDYQLIADTQSHGSDTSSHKVMLIAAKRQLLDERVEVCRDAGLSLNAVQADCVALHNLMVYDYWGGSPPDPHSDSAAVMAVDVGCDTTHVLGSAPKDLWFRSLNVGSDEFTSALIRAYHLTFDQAEQLKREPWRARRMRQLDEVLFPVRDGLVQEVARTVESYTKLCPETNIAGVLFIGGGFQLHGLVRHFLLGR